MESFNPRIPLIKCISSLYCTNIVYFNGKKMFESKCGKGFVMHKYEI